MGTYLCLFNEKALKLCGKKMQNLTFHVLLARHLDYLQFVSEYNIIYLRETPFELIQNVILFFFKVNFKLHRIVREITEGTNNSRKYNDVIQNFL